MQASAAALAKAGVAVTVVAARIEDEAPGGTLTIRERRGLCDAGISPQERLGDLLSTFEGVAHLHQLDDPDIVTAMQQRGPVVVSAHGYTACTAGVHYFRPGHECERPHGPGCVPHLIACAHDPNPLRLPARYRRATRGLQALLRADLAVSYSSAVDRHLAANGVQRRAIVPYFPTTAPRRRPAGRESRRVLFAGRVVPAKGVGVLIRAARDVEAEFVVCGDGWGLTSMRRLARRLRVAQRVHFTGWLSGDELAEQVAGASVIALPSVWPEPFGLVGIEALSAGRPVVASATGGVGDWLEHGVSGLCVRPGDAKALARSLNELLADPARRDAMGAEGMRAVGARFSAQRHLDALLEGYASARSRWAGEREPIAPAPAARSAPARAGVL